MAERDVRPSISNFDGAAGLFQNVGSQTIYYGSDGNKKTPRNFQFGLPPVVKITGRDEDVKKLTKLIDTEQHIVISGMSGVGKTSLSAHCAREWLKGRKLENVIFIDTETDTTMDNSIRDLCEQPDIGINNYNSQRRAHFMKLVYKKFTCDKLLVIFDNVISFRSVHEYLPPQDLCNIITVLTSQNREFRFYVYKLEVLKEETCLELVKNEFGKQWSEMKNQHENIKELMKKLQFLPLAVCQAVVYIKDQLTFGDKSYTIRKYLDNFEETFQDDFPEYTNDIYKKTVFTAIKINISRLDLDKKYGKRAKRVLYCMGYLDPSSIRENLLLPLFGLKEKDIIEVKRLLQKYSLIDSHSFLYYEYINIHRLVQDTCRILTKDGSDFNNNFKKILKEVISTDKYKSHLQFLKPYIENFGLDVLNEIYREMYSDGERKQRLKEALESVKYNMSAVESWTVVHYAVFEDNWDMLYLLKESGQKFREESRKWSVLHVAALHIDCDIGRVLMLEPGNVNVQTTSKTTALHLLLSGDHDIIDDDCWRCDNAIKLIKSGYDNSIVNKNGDTVTHLTFVNNHFRIMEYLLRNYNTDIFLRNNQGEDINTLAKKKHIILYKITSPSYNRSWYEPVQLKPLSSPEEGVALLKEQLNQRAPDSVWEKIVKLFENVPEVLRLTAAYIQHEQLSVTDIEEHFTALSENTVHQSFRENCYGYECQNIHILLYTILENLKINKKLSYIILVYISCFDNNEFLYVCELYGLLYKNIRKNIKELKEWFLFEQNEDSRCTVSDVVRYTTVMYSHERGDLEDVCVALITQRYVTDISVRYPREAGVQKVYIDMYNSERAARPEWLNKLYELKLVTEEDIGYFTALHWAVVYNDWHMIDRLLKICAPVNTATVRGVTPFHITATNPYFFYIKDKLLDVGVDMNARDITGNTPAHWAALIRNHYSVTDLQKHGADLTIKNNDGLTPGDILKRRNK